MARTRRPTWGARAAVLPGQQTYLTWDGALQGLNLPAAKDYEQIKKFVFAAYPSEPKNRLQNWDGQIWAFALPINTGNWIVLPRKTKGAIAFAEVKGAYSFDPGRGHIDTPIPRCG